MAWNIISTAIGLKISTPGMEQRASFLIRILYSAQQSSMAAANLALAIANISGNLCGKSYGP
jgi:hypothetical protein